MAAYPTLDAFRYVAAVVRLGSFSQAAAASNVSQPALSNSIARLEEQLGERIFDRSPRGVTLTAFGLKVAPLVDRALEAADEVSALAQSWKAARGGRLRIGVSPLIDGSLVAAVHSKLDELDLVFTEANMVNLQESLRAGVLDVLLIPSVRPVPGCDHRIIGSEPLVEISQGDVVTDNRLIDVCELEKSRFILVPDTCGLTAFTRDLFDSHKMELKEYPGEATSYRMLEEWAMLGLGSSLIPLSKLSAPDAPHQRLCDGDVDVEIFYEMIWDAQSPFAEVLAAVAEGLHCHGARA